MKLENYPVLAAGKLLRTLLIISDTISIEITFDGTLLHIFICINPHLLLVAKAQRAKRRFPRDQVRAHRRGAKGRGQRTQGQTGHL